MLEIHYELAGRKLDPCFINDSIQKTTLLRAAREVKRKFSDIHIPDCQAPLRILIKGQDIHHLRYELYGTPEVLALVKQQHGHTRNELIELAA